MVVVVAVVVMRMIVMGGSSVCFSPMTMSVVVMLDLIAARVTRMRPEYGDQAGQDGAQQRQKNDCLNHSCVSPSSN
jgi:hypothetical protein